MKAPCYAMAVAAFLAFALDARAFFVPPGPPNSSAAGPAPFAKQSSFTCGGAGVDIATCTDDLGNTWTKIFASDPTAKSVVATDNVGWAVITDGGNFFPSDTYIDNGAPSSANYSVFLTIKGVSTNGAQANSDVVGRADNVSGGNRYGCRIQNNGSNVYSWIIYKVHNGTGTVLVTSNSPSPLTYGDGTNFNFVLTMTGTTISCTVNGVSIGSVTDPDVTTAGHAGFAQFNQGNNGSEVSTAQFIVQNFKAQ